MRLIAVGRFGRGPERALFEDYSRRLRPKLALTEVPDGHGAPAEAKRRETEALLAALPPRAYAVALDQDAPVPSSEAFAHTLASWRMEARDIAFVIGGASGLGKAVLERADHVLSLGALTWPHMLVRVMLAEQIFRAQSILAGHPYHRAGRP